MCLKDQVIYMSTRGGRNGENKRLIKILYRIYLVVTKMDASILNWLTKNKGKTITSPRKEAFGRNTKKNTLFS